MNYINFFFKNKHDIGVVHVPSFHLSARSSSFFHAFFLHFYGEPFHGSPDIYCKIQTFLCLSCGFMIDRVPQLCDGDDQGGPRSRCPDLRHGEGARSRAGPRTYMRRRLFGERTSQARFYGNFVHCRGIAMN